MMNFKGVFIHHSQFKCAIAMTPISMNMHVYAEKTHQNNSAVLVADYNDQNDYICHAKPSNLITSNRLSLSSINTQRFGLIYSIKEESI